LPTIVNYDRQSAKQKISSTRGTANNQGPIQHLSDDMKVNSVSLSINRYNMVFAATQNNKDGGVGTGPLTQKNSSENMSISQSIPDPDVGGRMIRVPSNSSYLNRISHSG
jgi:hypothetical protein